MDDADDERSAASAKSFKSIKSFTKTMKALEKDYWRLKKSVSVLQKCDEDDDDDLSLSSVEGSTPYKKRWIPQNSPGAEVKEVDGVRSQECPVVG
jgi:hypothetical protein